MLENLEKPESVKIYTLLEDFAGYSTSFKAQHGISFLMECNHENKKSRILFDTGSFPEPVIHNLDLLDIDPGVIDMIVLSHNHYDHTGGLKRIVKEIGGEIPIFAHPNIFRKSFSVNPEFRYAGIPPLRGGTKEEIEELGGIWILTKDPIKLMPGIFILGEVKEKVNFEETANIDLYQVRKGRVSKDEIEDELGVGIITEEGLTVVAGCSHPGIVSMTEKAQEISDNEDLNIVMGGFHLKGAEKSRIKKTVSNLKDKNVNRVITGHCTGLKAETEFLRIFKDDFEKLHSGLTVKL